MNEEKPTLQNAVESLVKDVHPLHILDNQADPETKPKIILQKPIRTYEGDIAEALARKNTSVAKITIAENKKETGEERITNAPQKKKGNNFIMLILSLVFISAGIGIVYYLYLQSPLALPPVSENPIKISNIINADIQKNISVDNLSTNEIINKINTTLIKENTNPNSITELLITKNVENVKTNINGNEFIALLDTEAPDIFTRSIDKSWMLGINNDNSQNTPFIILTSDFFQNTYAGMLQWEKTMPSELSFLLNYNEKIINGRFYDRTVLNRDVREFINENAELLLLYSFINKDTLIITTSETTLKILIEKIEKQTYIR